VDADWPPCTSPDEISIDPDDPDPAVSPASNINDPELQDDDRLNNADVDSDMDPLDPYTDDPLDTNSDASTNGDFNINGHDEDDDDDRPPEIDTDGTP